MAEQRAKVLGGGGVVGGEDGGAAGSCTGGEGQGRMRDDAGMRGGLDDAGLDERTSGGGAEEDAVGKKRSARWRRDWSAGRGGGGARSTDQPVPGWIGLGPRRWLAGDGFVSPTTDRVQSHCATWPNQVETKQALGQPFRDVRLSWMPCEAPVGGIIYTAATVIARFFLSYQTCLILVFVQPIQESNLETYSSERIASHASLNNYKV
jgi:hypothetical protein